MKPFSKDRILAICVFAFISSILASPFNPHCACAIVEKNSWLVNADLLCPFFAGIKCPLNAG
jgi:hypothetical protein